MAERTWTTVGEEHIGTLVIEDGRTLTRELVEQAIEDLDWIETATNPTMPMMPALGIQSAIEQLTIPRVTKVAWCCRATDDPEFDERYPLAPFGFYGIEGNYSNGRACVYVLDLGVGLTPLCSELFTEEETADAVS